MSIENIGFVLKTEFVINCYEIVDKYGKENMRNALEEMKL